MKTRFLQTQTDIHHYSELPLHKRIDRLNLLYIGYGLFVVMIVLISYLVGLFNILPYGPDDMDMDIMMALPGVQGHLLGTDFMGRDLLTRLILGIQAYFLPGLLSILISLCLGSVMGILAGYWGGKYEKVVTYINNLSDSLPRLVLILLVVAAVKPDIYIIMVVVGLTSAPAIASLIKDKITFLKNKNFLEASIAIGLPTRVILFKHILWYSCRGLLIIQATLGMAEAILIETSLSYLGFGVQEPVPSWGNMIQIGADYLMQGHFWPSTAPALAILVTVLGFHLLGDGLNNVLEGRGRR